MEPRRSAVVDTGISNYVDGRGFTPRYRARYIVRFAGGSFDVYREIPSWTNPHASRVALDQMPLIREEFGAVSVDEPTLECNGRSVHLDPEAVVCETCGAGFPPQIERRIHPVRSLSY